jgi:hypothetical protein
LFAFHFLEDHVAFGEALSLNVKFHSRSGNKKQQLLSTIAPKCPVTAKESKYVTYTRQWKVPANTKPGSYAVEVSTFKLGVKRYANTRFFSIHFFYCHSVQ